MESKAHQMTSFQRGKSNFYFGNQFRILVYSDLQKSPSGNWNRLPNKENDKIAPITYKIAPLGGDFAAVEDHWAKG